MDGQALTDRFRIPPDYLDCLVIPAALEDRPRLFSFGDSMTCFGMLADGLKGGSNEKNGHVDVEELVIMEEGRCRLPFELTSVVEGLLFERYAKAESTGLAGTLRPFFKRLYYILRQAMPQSLRRQIQRVYLRRGLAASFPRWPVDTTVDRLLNKILTLIAEASGNARLPFIWFWPEGKMAAAMLTHDVESEVGLRFCEKLMDVDEVHGIRSSFQFVPEGRYRLPGSLLDSVRSRGFEVNVHGLNHDGRLFENYNEFCRRARRINHYRKIFKAAGFRSPVLYRNLDWYGELDFSYDMSVPTSGHLDPQRGGCCSVFPYFVGHILELPLTTTQDYSLFHMLGDYSIDLWIRQIEAITHEHGLISFNIHPDYITAQPEAVVYKSLLRHLGDVRERADIWLALPKEVNSWWRLRNEMRIERVSDRLQITGPGAEQARIAFAKVDSDNIVFEVTASNVVDSKVSVLKAG